MDCWSIFWICLFSYWAIKESVAMITYNKRQAIKELAEDEFSRQISELVNKKVKRFKNDKEAIRKHLDEIIDEIWSEE
jgi:hypothetical protein